MDFLKIRKKAKERAGQRSTPPAPEPPIEPGPRAPSPADPAAVPASASADPGALAERLQALPDPEGLPPEDPTRFTTWRPGSGERPVFPALEPAGPPPVAPEVPVFDPAQLRRAPVVAPEAPDAREPAASVRLRAGSPSAEVAEREQRDPLDEFFYGEDEQVPALAALPVDEAEARPDAADEGLEEYLTFRLGVEEYAVAIERVREVLKTQPITEVPRAPTGILGVVTVRGEVVPVFDPRGRLGLPRAPLPEGSGRIVIVNEGEGRCGLLVDGVESVVRLARGSIEPCPQGIGGPSADCLAGIGRERSRLFTVLDLDVLLRRAPGRGERTSHGAR